MGKKWILIIITFSLSLSLFTIQREIIIEDFNDDLFLESWEDEDYDPFDWSLFPTIEIDPPYALRLTGNTWKLQSINPIQLDSNTVWSIHSLCSNLGEIQGIGFSDGNNTLFYSFWGMQELDIEEWIPVYQGNFSENEWQEFQMPIADDWYAWYEYYPSINQIIYVNDNDSGSGTICFDYLCDITEDLPVTPEVEISWEINPMIRDKSGNRWVDINFFSYVEDPDSEELTYLWQFGDDSLSTEENPVHRYQVRDDHSYSVILAVTDETGKTGYAVKPVNIDPGETSLPLTINFVGDIMLARGVESTINTDGGEALFDPTFNLLGNGADISVANLECPLTTAYEHHPTKTVYFKGEPESAQYLQYAGIDIVSLANNHTLDYLYPGLQQTQNVLEEYGILYSGAGINSSEAYQPIFFNKKGISLAFLASSDRTGQYNNYQPYLQAGYNKPGFAYMTPYYVDQQIDEVKDLVDFVIVELHAGSEYSTEPGDNYDVVEPDDMYPEEDYYAYADIPHMWDIEIRHHIIESGADLVVIHHPHIIQGFELYQNKLIAHSLGNFIFDLDYPETMPSVILNAEMNKDEIYRYTVTPVFIDNNIPLPATGKLGLNILDRLADQSRQMNTILGIDRESVTAEILMDSLAITSYSYFHEKPVTLEFEENTYISEPIKLPGNGHLSIIQNVSSGSGWEYRLGKDIIWFGNFEPEGCSLWDTSDTDEFITNNVAHTGEHSLCQIRDNNDYSNIITDLEEKIKVYPAESHTIFGWVKTQNAVNVYIEARYYHYRNSGYPIATQQIDVDIPSTSDWTFYYQEIEIPENGNYMNIHLSSDCPSFHNSTVWFDDIGVIAWDQWDLLCNAEQIPAPNDYHHLQIKTENNVSNAILTFTETSFFQGPIVESNEDNIPSKNCVLKQNYPNPFNASGNNRKSQTTIEFTLPKTSKVKLSVYNIKGQLIKALVNEKFEKGTYKTDWDGKDNFGRDVSTGIYFYNLKTDDSDIAKKMILLR